MSEKFTDFDVSDLLTSEGAIEAFLTEAMETGMRNISLPPSVRLLASKG